VNQPTPIHAARSAVPVSSATSSHEDDSVLASSVCGGSIETLAIERIVPVSPAGNGTMGIHAVTGSATARTSAACHTRSRNVADRGARIRITMKIAATTMANWRL
jgi:hypothetical protein